MLHLRPSAHPVHCKQLYNLCSCDYTLLKSLLQRQLVVSDTNLTPAFHTPAMLLQVRPQAAAQWVNFYFQLYRERLLMLCQGSDGECARSLIGYTGRRVAAVKQSYQARGFEQFVDCSFVEVFNESCRDLLKPGELSIYALIHRSDACCIFFLSSACELVT